MIFSANYSADRRSRRARAYGYVGFTVVTAVLLALVGGMLAAAPALAASTAVLDISKTVDHPTDGPGDTFTYSIAVTCATDNCINASLTDVIPTQFDALTVATSLGVTPPKPGDGYTSTWSGPNNRTLNVNFTEALPGGQVGIAAGDGYTVQVTLSVPPGLSPDFGSNGVAVTNTASVSADNADTKTDSADVTITVPVTVDTTVTKSWTPASTLFKIGEPSVVTLNAKNASNALARSLVVQDPADPTAAGNPFENVDLASLGTLTLPAGADEVFVDAYVNGNWTSTSVPSTPSTLALPAGVSASDVDGLRFTFDSSTGKATLTAAGSSATVKLNLVQRATRRTAGTTLVNGATVTNIASSTVTVPGQTAVTKQATANYTVNGLTSVVTAAKSFSPARIPAGGSTVALISAGNASNGPLTTLTVTEPGSGGFFTSQVTFGGFTAASSWPTGATSADIVWSVNTGTAPATSQVTSVADMKAATPTLSTGQYITGFALTYTGSIGAGVTAGDAFTVNVSADTVTDPSTPVTLSNTAQVSGANDAGQATPKTATASVVVLAPQISMTESKLITPSVGVMAGGRSTVQLTTITSSDTAYVAPTTITITDQESSSPLDYWNAFNAVAISPTSVPQGSTLTISYTTDGTAWTALPVIDATARAVIYSNSLPNAANITGLKFVYNNPSGYALTSIVKPAISFEARSELRDGSGSTSTVSTLVTYTNNSTVTGVGHVTLAGNPIEVDGSSSATATAIVKSLPTGAGSSGIIFDKKWLPVGSTNVTDVSSQSGQLRTAQIDWGTQLDGMASAVVSDPADPTQSVATTVFQAFDLTKINPITTATDPLIAFDEVTGVQLYNGTAWVEVATPPCTVAIPCAGSFPGYALTTAEVASTVGVRLTFAPDDQLRATDPLTPPVGSGIASSPNSRPITLVFQLRNTLRDSTGFANPWVTQSKIIDSTDPSVVSNTAGIVVTPITGSPITGTASDTINIIDSDPNVSATKSVSAAALAIPNPGDVAPSAYPTDTYTLKATNLSPARAWDLRVTDPMPCPITSVSSCTNNDAGAVKGYTINPYASASYDPATNPFEEFTITSITPTLSTNSGIVLASSTATLWHYDPATGTTSTTTVPANSAVLTTAASLTDVVGVSIQYTSTSTANGGAIASGAVATTKITVQLRPNLRSTSAQATPTPMFDALTVANNSFTQIYDDVLPDVGIIAAANASVNLLKGTIAVTAAKSITTGAGATSLLEANRAADEKVTLTAGAGTSTAAPDQVVIEDSTAAFWNAFTLKSLGAITLPAGADQVRIDAQVDGLGVWTTGTFASAATAALPAGVTAPHVTALRFTFSRADGTIFSHTAPATTWAASAVLTVNLRNGYLDSGNPIPFPSTVTDTVLTSATHPVFGTASNSATASFALDPGTFSVDVVKTPSVKTTPAGQDVDWTLKVANTGTGYLTNPTVVDSLPIDATLGAGGPLLYEPTLVPTYGDSSGGILPTTGVGVSYDPSTRKVSFSWPAGSRLAPGEIYTIDIDFEVAPGLQANYGNVVNTFAFSSDRTLSACTNSSGNLQGVSWSTDKTTCSTSNSVTTFAASAITSFKGVKGNVDSSGNSTSGATNITDPSIPCVSDSDGFYRTPCAANTVIGGTDLWKLQFTNGGNIPATSATIVDVLPHNGDTFLRTTGSRGSTFTPEFAGDLSLVTDSLSAGTTLSWQVTTSSNPCSSFNTNTSCTTATWSDGPSFATSNYKSVTGVRIIFDFANTSTGALAPAATLKVTYQTVNTPSSSSSDNRAPTTVPVSGARAWNTFGAFATFGSGYASRLVEPVQAGVQLQTGPIQITKIIAGPSALYAPVSYSVTASCTVAGASVTLPNDGLLTLNSSSTIPYTARIDGIPVGAVCDFTEAASGASAVAYSPATTAGTAAEVTVGTAASSAVAVPSAQQATVTNTYGDTSLTITKKVSTTTTVGNVGPFGFSLSCTVNNGLTLLPVTFGDGSKLLAFTLADGDSTLIDSLPVNSVCALSETDSDHASSIAASVDGGASSSVVEGGTISVPLAAGSAHTALVTNTFDGGQLAITKTVDGTGGATYGSGPFAVSVLCTYQGQTLLDSPTVDAPISITGGQTLTLSPIFPVGTSCDVHETDGGGATSSTGAATVLIPAPTGTQTVGLVTTGIRNTFSTGGLKITKKVVEDAGTAYGDVSYEATVTCTWVKDDTTLTIALPNSGIVALTAANGYTATIRGLIAGASCAVVESKTGGATISRVGAVTPSVIPAGGASAVTITNTFDTGSLVIDKVRTGPGALSFGNGPFTAQATCSYNSDGTTVPITLANGGVVTLSSATGYTSTISGILDGASCSVVETDPGLAVSSTLLPSNGTVTIDGSQQTQATVTIMNDFEIGQLTLVKTASESIVEGDSSYTYTFDVSNTGKVNATGVELTDPLDPTLKVTNIDSPGWTDCAVTGADTHGYGGTLDCLLDDDLAIGSAAPPIVITVSVLATIAQDEIDNTATVSSTSPVVSGDTSTADVPVKWLDVTASSSCTKDAPYLDYSIVAHNLAVMGQTLTVNWADSDGTSVHTDSQKLTADGTVTGSMLWPGAAVNSSGDGIAWPGYRAALPGDTPDWNGLVLDPSAYGYGLRDNPLITFSIDPQETVTVQYPADSADCTGARAEDVLLTKTASVTSILPGAPFTYTLKSSNVGLGAIGTAVLTDPVPSTLHVTKVTPAKAKSGMPGWQSCTLTGTGNDGTGGTVTCTLDRPLLYGQSAPDVVLSVYADKNAPVGMIVNTADLTADAPAELQLPILDVQSTARVISGSDLAFTGVQIGWGLLFGSGLGIFGLFMFGLALALRRFRRPGVRRH